MASLTPFWEEVVHIAVAFLLIFLFVTVAVPGSRDEWR